MIAPIEQLPRPRQVSIKSGDLAMRVAASIALVIFSIYFLNSAWNSGLPQSLFYKTFSVLWVMLMIYVISGNVSAFIRDQKLLADGEVALGRVFHIRRGRHRRMEFSFQDARGRTFTALAGVGSPSIHEGSAIVVFYDPSNPEKRCVPMSGTLWKIALPESVAKT
ncbi:MAG TPA: DUF3592 domain-containing protein [Candidatus Acidoferrales bacterium]|nr:DUF3592 domain-containing protein [Candidatus Acidoferrales bacterium]